ncbi:MAG: glycosyltransferase [Holophagaceae bacterium]|nr:glycosyltransferase [Holophagaceae bacterium]
MTFSLLMPSYNQAHFIEEAVQSVLAQEDGDWELLILDNSTDQTPAVMAKFTDPRIQFHHQPGRMDVGTCLNWMLARAKGPEFSYIHTDNRLLPCFVGDHKQALSAHPMAVAVCDYWEIDEAGRRQKRRKRPDPFPLRRLFSTDSIGVPFASTLELARTVGGFSTDDLADDVLFVLLADAYGPRIHLHKPQMEYRVHGGSRFLQEGVNKVQRAIYRSVLRASRDRPPTAPDPFEEGLARAQRHVAIASRMALIRCRSHLRALGGVDALWISGTGPGSFWMAWACAELHRAVAGFVDTPVIGAENLLLGLPVKAEPPLGARILYPRSKGRTGAVQALRWISKGLPPLDHKLKRLPADVMSGLLVPFHRQTPEAKEIWIKGSGALAAYLAYGAEVLGGVKVRGFLSRESPLPSLGTQNGMAGLHWDLPD